MLIQVTTNYADDATMRPKVYIVIADSIDALKDKYKVSASSAKWIYEQIKFPTMAQLKQIGESKGEIAKAILPADLTYDCTLPQQWLNDMATIDGKYDSDRYSLIRYGTVWAYPPGSIFGEARALCLEVEALLNNTVVGATNKVVQCNESHKGCENSHTKRQAIEYVDSALASATDNFLPVEGVATFQVYTTLKFYPLQEGNDSKDLMSTVISRIYDDTEWDIGLSEQYDSMTYQEFIDTIEGDALRVRKLFEPILTHLTKAVVERDCQGSLEGDESQDQIATRDRGDWAEDLLKLIPH